MIAGLLLIALLIWAGKPSSSTRSGQNGFGGGPVPVGVARANVASVAVTLNALGTVTPLATVTVKPQITGILEQVNFREGQAVKAGDVLAHIDPRPYQASLGQAKGQLERDAAQLTNARLDLARYRALLAQNAIAQQTLATQTALVRADEGTVAADKAAVDAAQVNLGYCTITAPVAGRVGLRQVDVGNLVQAGITSAIAVVTQLQPISVLFTLPEDDLIAVMGRVNAGATLSADAYDRTQTTKLASGTLSTVDNQVDPTTGTVKMRALFPNVDNRLFPQQFVNIQLVVNTLLDQTVVPAAAIQRGAGGSFVYVVNPDKTVSVRSVGLGPSENDRVDVTSGLKPGDLVVVDGADRLKEGARVTLPGAIPASSHTRSAGRRHRRTQGGDGTGGPL